MTDIHQSNKQSSGSSHQMSPSRALEARRTLCTSSSRPTNPLTVRDLKKLRLKAGLASEVEQMNFLNNLLRIPEEEHSVFFADAGDPPLDHLLDEGNIDDSLEMEYVPRDKVSGDVLKDDDVNVASDRRRESGPVDLDEIEDDIHNEDETRNDGVERQVSGPVDLDEETLDHVDDDQGEDYEDLAKKYSEPVDVDMVNDRSGGPIDLDSVHDREADFEMIWKENEDEFFTWKDNKRISKNNLKYGASSRKKSPQPSAFQTSVHKNDFSSVKQKYREKNETYVVPVAGIYQDLEETTPATEAPHADDMASLASMDTYGFSLAETLDTYGFSKADRKIPPSPQLKSVRDDQGDFSESFVGSFEEEKVADGTVTTAPAVGSEESRARTIRRINDLLQRDRSDNSSVGTPLATKARGLRALRLKTSKGRAYGAILEPSFATVHEHEEMTSALYSYDAFNADTVGLVVQISDDHADGTQSIVSEISNLSDKLWLKHPSPESKWDDLSSVGLSGVEGRAMKEKDSYLVTSNDNIMIVGEIEGHDVEAPPVIYDSSVKTPPFLFGRNSNYNGMVDNEQDAESKWDDVSSIGLLGVEGSASVLGPKNRDCTDARIPIDVITQREGNCVASQNKEHRSTKVLGTSNKDSVFRVASKRDLKSKKSSKIPDLELNPTFSTVWGGDSDMSSSDGDSQEDVEQQARKEVSSTSASSSDVKDQKALVAERHNSRSLTTRDWWILFSILVITITAITVVVVYVYANL